MNGRWNPVSWFERLWIRNKIIAVYIPLIIVPLLILGIVSSRIFTGSLIEKMKRNSIDESNLILSQVNSIIQNTESCANILTTDLNKILSNNPETNDAYGEGQFRGQIESQLAVDLLIFPDVDSAVFIERRNSNIFTSYASTSDKDKEVFRSGILEKLQTNETFGVNHWLPMQQRAFLVTDPQTPVLTLGKIVTDINTGLPFGTLLLNVKESSLSSAYLNMSKGSPNHYFVLDNRGMIISAPEAGKLLKPLQDDELNRLLAANGSFSQVVHTDASSNLVTSDAYDKMNWKLVNVVPMNMLTGDIQKNSWMIAFIGIVCLLFGLVGAGVLSRVIVRPLFRLTKAMRKVKDGDLDSRSDIQTQDEIGLLTSVFNTMISQIQDLLQRVETEQRMKKEYELALIHAQIKPHFLYNTLDLIYVLNDLNRIQEARDTTKALADYYRIALSKGKEIITVGEEIKNAADYLVIQQMRYPDVFDFSIHVPSELLNEEIPKLSLQPLVENAIYHGLKTKGSFGHIDIDGEREGTAIVLRVKDDGIGMSEEKARAILGFGSGERHPASFGIFSVHERIRLYFGDQYGVSIQSEPGKGTEVRIMVPADNSRRKTYV
ncbi:two-component system, sensor histidine kinase YesM [Paenibacillus sp. yr247]|uniref:sensor histidine kinase n=1 Tax=Paenibacillus sp. yr247 TaxID=1761880 RepID=UPI000880C132|nr:sensor histidine kinase [Paenibacillus sp. yr247]SDP03526.1 two-component system, sensor histidine kinase YesM [Paenibacillus sp. yr247]